MKIIYDYPTETGWVIGESVEWFNVDTEAPLSGERIKAWIEKEFGLSDVEITRVSRSAE